LVRLDGYVKRRCNGNGRIAISARFRRGRECLDSLAIFSRIPFGEIDF